MAAAMVLGPDVFSPPGFDAGIIALAFVVHFLISVFYALILARIVHGKSVVRAALTGAVFGSIVFFADMYVLTDVFFPWFAELRNGITFFSHVVLGAVMGGSYVALAGRYKTIWNTE